MSEDKLEMRRTDEHERDRPRDVTAFVVATHEDAQVVVVDGCEVASQHVSAARVFELVKEVLERIQGSDHGTFTLIVRTERGASGRVGGGPPTNPNPPGGDDHLIGLSREVTTIANAMLDRAQAIGSIGRPDR